MKRFESCMKMFDPNEKQRYCVIEHFKLDENLLPKTIINDITNIIIIIKFKL